MNKNFEDPELQAEFERFVTAEKGKLAAMTKPQLLQYIAEMMGNLSAGIIGLRNTAEALAALQKEHNDMKIVLAELLRQDIKNAAGIKRGTYTFTVTKS